MEAEKESRWISGFWRRIGALFIDSVILGIAGIVLGLVLAPRFVELGGWGRLVGFFIALTYFGILNSKLADGQTIGKKVLKIRVVNADNQTIGVLRSFARYSILGIPFFLNGAHFTNEVILSSWMYPLSLVIFGGILSIVYLYIFNRVTRQSLHDLVVGSYVVNANVAQQALAPVWKPHFIVVGIILLSTALIPAFTSKLIDDEPFKQLLSAQTALIKNPSVSFATVSYGSSHSSSADGGTRSTTYASSQVFLKQDLLTDAALAQKLAHILVSRYPESLQKDVIQINLIYGYDIGIAYQWHNQSYNFRPDELVP